MTQITVTFNGYEEMKEFAGQLLGGGQGTSAVEKKMQDPQTESKTPAAYGQQIAKDFPEANTKPISQEKAEDKTEDKVYTLVDVRGKLSELTKSGKKAQVQELIKSFGADKLSGIPEEKYAEVMQKAGEL